MSRHESHEGENAPVFLAVVAEYRGRALIERPGNNRTVWEGREYFTDGKMYVMRRSDQPGMCQLIGLPSEPVAKAFLDERSEEELEEYYSLPEAEESLGLDEFNRRINAQLKWKWDDKQQVFVQVRGRMDISAERGWGKVPPEESAE